MDKCIQCGNVIISRDIQDSKIKNKRWTYWNTTIRRFQEFEKIKDPIVQQENLKRLRISLSYEYNKNIDILEKRQRELLDVEIEDSPQEVMDLIKYAIHNYVMEKFVVSVIICGAASEYILEDLIDMTDLSITEKNKIKKIRSEDIKLLLCRYIGLLTQNQYSKLIQIRKMRNYYAHPQFNQQSKSRNEIQDAKKSIRYLIDLANRFYLAKVK